MVNKNRALYIFKYLWDHTDEEHPATTADIIAYLASMGISTTRKTVAEDAAELQNSGFDVVCNRSRQNEYFIGTRHLELAELKLLVDAVQAARFISPKKSRELIGKVTGLTSPHQGESLRRSLFVDGKVKTGNEAVYYAVDILHTAIQQQKTVMFKYIEYTPTEEKAVQARRTCVCPLSLRYGLEQRRLLCVRLLQEPRQGGRLPGRPHVPPRTVRERLLPKAGGL